ncbi:acyltransferase [Vibrio mytili]|uniref:Acyltransferase 3 domain-containing protein n=1 Tax=Vibrio mytili TaxID=50718 RepID=A0A0C3IC96_9VIBR|nr:acyltransferase [Vibrio mytili]KIN11947.1 hypothetical protein SU60_05475 [Vibrio mytili]
MRQHLQSIENYRGFAIVCIVAVHCFDYGMTATSGFWLAFQNFFYGSTALFVFISGYMFHHVFCTRKAAVKDFYSSKFKAVILPYLFLGTFATCLLYVTRTGFYENGIIIDSRLLFDADDSTLVTTLKYLATGRMLTAYWYIPFAFLLFAMAPLHLKFVQLKGQSQAIIIVLLCVLSLFVHRSYENTNPIQMLVYFTPIYLLGCSFSKHRDYLLVNAKLKMMVLVVILLALCVYEAYIGHRGNYIKEMLAFEGIDTMFIQKVCMVLALFYAFELYQFKNKLLSLLAKTSFGVFFIHPWVLTVLKRTPVYEYAGASDTNVLLFFVTLLFTLVASVSIVVLVKATLRNKPYSRYVTGY